MLRFSVFDSFLLSSFAFLGELFFQLPWIFCFHCSNPNKKRCLKGRMHVVTLLTITNYISLQDQWIQYLATFRVLSITISNVKWSQPSLHVVQEWSILCILWLKVRHRIRWRLIHTTSQPSTALHGIQPEGRKSVSTSKAFGAARPSTNLRDTKSHRP